MNILTAKVNDIEMDYCKFGTGEKVFVIIPGLSLRSVMLSAGAVAVAYKQFTENYTVYLFDRRKNIAESYSVREMAHDTAEIMKSLGIKDADIFGTSQGGMIAQFIAIDYPELAHSIVLGSTCSRANDTIKCIINTWCGFAEKYDVKALNHSFFENVYSDAFLKKHGNALEFLESQGTLEECDRFKVFAEACADFNAYNELEKVKCPALVLGAEQDKVLTAEASVELVEKLGCELYIYENFGHAVYDEAEDYKDRIMNFMKKI